MTQAVKAGGAPPRVLLAVRTHRADAASLAMYDAFAQLPGVDVAFACDERNGEVAAGGRRKTGYDLARLERMGLFAHPKCGWRCGDYNYYMLREDFPDYDQYWLIEPDVAINTQDLAAFFAGFAAREADFLAPLFGPRDAKWGWTAHILPDYPRAYGCLFPVTRISARAIDYLYAARRAASAARAANDDKRWPNDESFVASALMAGGMACADLNSADRVVATRASMRVGVLHDAAHIAALPPDGVIYHPVRQAAGLLRNAEKKLEQTVIAGASPVEMRKHVYWLMETARTCLSNTAYEGAALALLTLARQPVEMLDDAAAEAEAARAIAAGHVHLGEKRFPHAARAAFALHRKHFAPAKGAPAVASAHVAVAQRQHGSLILTNQSDFALGPAVKVGRFPHGFALPYAFDFTAETLMFTLHVAPETLLSAPFLYMAQRDRGQVAALVPFAKLAEVTGAPDGEAAPVFIFSFGRTGSTLLGKLIACITPRSFLEPDTVTQLATFRKTLTEFPAAMQQQLIWSAIAPFQQTHIEAAGDARSVIKLRSQANGVAADIAGVFPKARYVFMTRDRKAWAKSTYRAFHITPEAAAARLVQGVAAVHALTGMGVDLAVISYEDVVADPARAVCRLMGLEPDADPALLARLRHVMAQDSQASARISRDKTGQKAKGEEEWMAAFEAVWAARRPAAMLEALRLDL